MYVLRLKGKSIKQKGYETGRKEFAALVKEHKSTIYSICYMFSKDKDEIDDLFQETLVHLWQGYKKFRNESKIETWIYRVTMNTCISMDKKEKRRGEHIALDVNIDLFDETDKDMHQIQMLYKRIHRWACLTGQLLCCGWRT